MFTTAQIPIVNSNVIRRGALPSRFAKNSIAKVTWAMTDMARRVKTAIEAL